MRRAESREKMLVSGSNKARARLAPWQLIIVFFIYYAPQGCAEAKVVRIGAFFLSRPHVLHRSHARIHPMLDFSCVLSIRVGPCVFSSQQLPENK